MSYHNYTTDELLDLAGNETGTLASELAGRVVSIEKFEEMESEIESLKDEIRGYELSDIMEECKKYEQAMEEYHKSEDYLSNYLYQENIADSLAYGDYFKDQIMRIDPDITDQEYDYLVDQIIHAMIGTDIKMTYMNTCESRDYLVVCSFIMGETEEQLPRELIKQFVALKMTEGEIEKSFDNYYRDGTVFFDYSYNIVGLYVTAESIFECIAEYRGDK